MIDGIVSSGQIGRILTFLALVVCFSAVAQEQRAPNTPAVGAKLRVTHILGFEGISSNANGDLSIQGDAFRFQKSDGSGAQVTLGAIQDVFVGQQDKQVGGTPMTVGKIAAPFGGGRVIGLFAHKKYDTVTLHYLDAEGGFHGAIFQLSKGQGQTLENELEAAGAHVTRPGNDTTKGITEETKNEGK